MTINTKERHGSIGFTINAVAAVLTIPVCVIRSETTAPDFSTSSGKQCERFFTVELQQLSNPLFIGSKTFNFPDETRGKESPSRSSSKPSPDATALCGGGVPVPFQVPHYLVTSFAYRNFV
ncbi:hypothetical protein DY000_02031676 [Brassica cretica]|uniref:Uncharacterized protein n=1 Tax=Brassica cretica TaxID=69181 RepID=A0ABQ7DPS6_BRACR|nr:hypothetical protein DY000_02031676 [Brassica cretica]